ncbi:MAG: hypothetical protein IIC94_09285 [Chloroflexi bacterium]|nr:hypothetical protein [Chloroflexota bacterium]
MKKLLISLLVAGVLVGAVYGAAASLAVGGADDLGSGSDTVLSPDTDSVTVTDIVWTIDPNDATKISAATVELTASDTGDETCDVGLNINSSGGDPGDLFSGVDPAVDISQSGTANVIFSELTVDAALVDSVDVTLACDD